MVLIYFFCFLYAFIIFFTVFLLNFIFLPYNLFFFHYITYYILYVYIYIYFLLNIFFVCMFCDLFHSNSILSQYLSTIFPSLISLVICPNFFCSIKNYSYTAKLGHKNASKIVLLVSKSNSMI